MHPDQQVNLAHLSHIFRIDKHISHYVTEQVHKETEGLEKECREAAVTMWSVAAFTDVLRMHSADVPLCCRLLAQLARPHVAEPTNLLIPSRVCTAVLDALSLLRQNQDLLAAVFIEMDRRGEVSSVRHVARLVCRSFFHSLALPHYETEFMLFIGRLLELALLPGVDPRQVLFGESSAFANLLSAWVDHSPSFRAFLDASLRIPLLAGLSSTDSLFELGLPSLLVSSNNGTDAVLPVSSTDQQSLVRQILSSMTSARSALPQDFIWLLSRVSSLLAGRFNTLTQPQSLTMGAELAARCLALAIADPFILNLVDDFLVASPQSITLLGQVANLFQRHIIDSTSCATGDQQLSRDVADLVATLFPAESPQTPELVAHNEGLPLAMLLTGSELRLLVDSCRTLSAIQSEAAGRLATYVAAIPLTVLPQSAASALKEISQSPLCALLHSDVLLNFPALADVFAMVGLPDRHCVLASSELGLDYQQQQQQQQPQQQQQQQPQHQQQHHQQTPAVSRPQPILALRWYSRRRRAERTASTHSSGSADERRMRPMEKRTRFMLTHGYNEKQVVSAAAAACGDLEPSEAASTQFDPSEAASTHSCVSLDNDGSLSDVSGRATPDVSGRDTPLSAPAEPEAMSGSVGGTAPISVATSIAGSFGGLSSVGAAPSGGAGHGGGFAVPNAPTPRSNNRTPGSELRSNTSSSSHTNRQPTDDVTEKFGKFDIKPEILAASAKAPSDTWSTDVMASEVDWAGSEPGGEDSSRWSVEPEADDAPSVSEIEHENFGGSSSCHGGGASTASYGAAAADDIDDEEMMMMVAAADANRFETSGSTDWGEPPAVPESATASWSMLFRPIAPAYDDLSDRASDRASTSSARESFGGASSVQFGASAASQAMSRIKNPFKQLGDKLKKGKRKATSSSSSKPLSSLVGENDNIDEAVMTSSGVISGTATLRPSNSSAGGLEAPADILRKYERTSLTNNGGSNSVNNTNSQHSMSTPSLNKDQLMQCASGPSSSAMSSPMKGSQMDVMKQESASARHSSTTCIHGSTYSEQMLLLKMKAALTDIPDPSVGVLSSLQRAAATGPVTDRAVAREALRGYRQAVSNGSADQLMGNLATESDTWPTYYTQLFASLLHTISMRSRTTSLTASFRSYNDALVRCLATRLASVLLMGDAERRLLDDSSNRFRCVQMDERTDVVLAMSERITTAINQWLTAWVASTANANFLSLSVIANLRHITLFQVERVFFSRNYTAGLYSAPSIRICQETDERFAQHVARLSVVLTADHPLLALPQPLQRDVPWPAVQLHIREMASARHPLDKIACICDAIISLSRLLSLALQGGPVASDHQLPALVLVLVRANAPHLLSTRTYIQTFIGMTDIQSVVIQSTSPNQGEPAQWPWRHSPEVMRFAFAQFSTAVAAIQQLIQQLIS